MSAISYAVIGKNNEPLYLKEFYDESSRRRIHSDMYHEEELFGFKLTTTASSKTCGVQRTKGSDCSLRQQFILHAALDRFDELCGPPPGCAWRAPGASGADAMFVGLLCPIEDMRVYGYMTTTQMRFLLTVEDDAVIGDQKTIDDTIKQLFVKLHRVYVEYMLNPFSPLSGPIKSDAFDQKVEACVRFYNRALH